ncbi:MAG TPA: hypothetical protein VFP34_04540 [Microlunatus sp.]|nr:hypothetical protein [Microlunatus sp.]
MNSDRWWGRSRGLPITAYSTWRVSLTALGRPARVLGWARTPTGYCIGSPAALSVGDENAFTHLGWHEIQHGGWNAETRRLSWVCYPGPHGRSRRGFVVLDEPARLPELFRERVSASMVFERFVPLVSSVNGGVTISARRDLSGAADQITWHASPSRGVDWRDESVRAEAQHVLARVRTEYDTAPAGW